MKLIYGRDGAMPLWLKPDELEYGPDVVAKTPARTELEATDALAKRDATVQWCRHGTIYAVTTGGKPWMTLLRRI